jgi:hypothetical protein
VARKIAKPQCHLICPSLSLSHWILEEDYRFVFQYNIWLRKMPRDKGEQLFFDQNFVSLTFSILNESKTRMCWRERQCIMWGLLAIWFMSRSISSSFLAFELTCLGAKIDFFVCRLKIWALREIDKEFLKKIKNLYDKILVK